MNDNNINDHDKPEVLALSGKKPSSLVKSSLESFELSFSPLEEDFRFRASVGFLALCISLHLEPLEHLPLIKNSSHSKMCFLLHCQRIKENIHNQLPSSFQLFSFCFWF